MKTIIIAVASAVLAVITYVFMGRAWRLRGWSGKPAGARPSGTGVPWWRKAGRRVGRRGAFLTFLALLDVSYGYSLFIAPRAVQKLDLLLPWRAWAVLWLVMAAVSLSGAPLRRDRVQYTLAEAFATAWGLMYVQLSVARHVADAWISAVVWLALAATIYLISGWPEPVSVVPVQVPSGTDLES